MIMATEDLKQLMLTKVREGYFQVVKDLETGKLFLVLVNAGLRETNHVAMRSVGYDGHKNKI